MSLNRQLNEKDSNVFQFITYQMILNLLDKGKTDEAREILEKGIEILYDPELFIKAMGYLNQAYPKKTNIDSDSLSEQKTASESSSQKTIDDKNTTIAKKLWNILISIYRSIVKLICLCKDNEAVEFNQKNKTDFNDAHNSSTTKITKIAGFKQQPAVIKPLNSPEAKQEHVLEEKIIPILKQDDTVESILKFKK